jgi:hypothetical protein
LGLEDHNKTKKPASIAGDVSVEYQLSKTEDIM